MEPKKFSWKERGNSFTYAWAGIKAVFRTEHNTWIHLVLTCMAMVIGFVLKISPGGIYCSYNSDDYGMDGGDL